ncbi:NAD(P)/FAD-dependent oxidoreductase [Actinoplanes subtropicus]|uniref:NAD(P)/FAD-dependent oxidoreductase n=1 Tax=Actinoplanes subtropicus TaxID=543632 RepID=UPI0004C2F37B|nr:FAD-dependent oxidoreductase [Actinoplanes subtropicus]
MRKPPHRIVVAGAGYAGMMATIGLARRTRRLGTQITLVNPSSRFVERLRLHQIAAGQDLPVHRIPDILAGTGVRFVEGRITAIDPIRQAVEIDRDWQEYDTLVYAVGSATATAAVPGVAQHAYTLNGLDAAKAFAARLPGAARVMVCGGGLTGVEAATEVAESHPRLAVTLVSETPPGTMMGPRARDHLYRGFERLGVAVVPGVRVTKVRPDGVDLADGGSFPADVVLWTSGVEVTPVAGAAGLSIDEHGRVITDTSLRSVSHPQVFAVGDAAAVRQRWGTIHGTCQSGIPTGAFAAQEIARQLAGREPRPFRFGYVHQPVSIGRRDAVIQFTFADDTPRRAYLTGRPAILYKQFVSSSPIYTYRLARRLKVSARMLAGTGGRRQR